MTSKMRPLKAGCSVIAIVAASLAADPARAQPASVEASEEVVVTGTSIRGLPPVGSNLITVGPAEIQTTGAQTINQILSTVPSLTGMGNAAQGQLSGSSYFAPNIHQLGSSASSSTLVLIDGHRIPLGAIGHDQADPNIIPTSAIERVEVLADGSSSIYGSDAVAGVVNFITRKSFEGVQLGGQASFARGFASRTANLLAGTHWENGAAMFAYSFSSRGSLANAARPELLYPDHTAQGGTNFMSFNCSPASVQPNGAGNIYLSPGATGSVANNNANAPCFNLTGTLLPAETRNNVMARLTQSYGKLDVSVDLLWSNYNIHSSGSSATLTATAFGGGAQANPFYIAPPGVTAPRETVRFDFNGLIPLSFSQQAADVFYANTSFEYPLNDNYKLTVNALFGKSVTTSKTQGALCASCAYLALNGTTNAAGSTTNVSIPGTNVLVTQLPLTPATALDVWSPAASNRTSPDVRAALASQKTMQAADRLLAQLRANVDGTLFELPAGPVRVALGGEYIRYGNLQDVVNTNNTGPSNNGSAYRQYRFQRTVYSAYGEIAIPIVSAAAEIPLVQSFDVDISGRYDDYSDVGTTANPKFAANWTMFDGLKLRGNISTSFVAPAMDSFGDPSQSFNASYSGVSTYSGQINVPTANYPGLAGVMPGCAAGAAICTVGTSTTPGIRFIRGGGANLRAQTGRGWSAGADFTPDFLPGFQTQLTYFHQKLLGGVTSPNAAFAVNAPGLLGLMTFCPTGCTATQINALTAGIPVTGSLPSPAYFINNFDQRNVLNLFISGLDFQVNYRFETAFGKFRIGDSLTEFTRFDQQVGNGGAVFSVLNTNGFNQTFPSIQTQMRASLGWTLGNFDADMFVNFTGSYRNWGSNSVRPILTNSAGTPVSGGDRVESNTTLDLHLSYAFDAGALGSDEVFLDASNLLNKRPPFYNGATGYDSYVASPMGRILSVGLRAKL